MFCPCQTVLYILCVDPQRTFWTLGDIPSSQAVNYKSTPKCCQIWDGLRGHERVHLPRSLQGGTNKFVVRSTCWQELACWSLAAQFFFAIWGGWGWACIEWTEFVRTRPSAFKSFFQIALAGEIGTTSRWNALTVSKKQWEKVTGWIEKYNTDFWFARGVFTKTKKNRLDKCSQNAKTTSTIDLNEMSLRSS